MSKIKQNTKMKPTLSFYNILFFLLPLQVLAQTGSISGHIESGEAHLPFANIIVEEIKMGMVADDHGHFTIENIPVGSYKISCQLIGYKKQVKDVIVKEGKELELHFNLQEDVFGLEQVVISATRNEQNRKEAPVIVNVIDRKIFEATQSVTLSEGLNFQPGLRLENNCQNCGFSQVRMNGLEGAYSQILIDGRPTFSALNGVYGLDQIPTNMIERVEIIRGGGSALYGANAIAGTINIITKEPLNNFFQLSTNSALIDGKRADHTLSINGAIVTDDYKGGISFFGIKRDRNWYDSNGDGFSEITELNNNSFGFKAYYKTKDTEKFTLESHFINEYRRGGNRFDFPAHLSDITEQLDHKIAGGQFSYEKYSDNLKNKFSTYLSTQVTERDSYYGGGGNTTDPDELLLAASYYGKTEDLSLIYGLQFSANLKKLWAGDLILTVGNESQFNQVEDRIPGYRRVIDQKVFNNGTYAQAEIQPTQRLRTLIGVRYDQVNIDGNYEFGTGAPRGSDITLGTVNPRFNILYDLTEDMQIRTGIATGFRAPQAFDEELHLETLNGTVQFIRLSDELDTERSYTYTLAYDINKTIGNTAIYFLADAFYTRLDNPFVNELTDEVLEGSGAQVVDKRNGKGAYVTGVNLELNIAPSPDFQIQSGATIQRNAYDEAETIIELADGSSIESAGFLRSPDVYGFFAANWNTTKKWTTNISGVYTGPMDISYEGGSGGPLGDGTATLFRTDDFLEINTKFSYSTKLGKELDIKFNFGVQNVFNSFQNDFDEGPNRNSNYIYGPTRPRTFFFGIKINS